MRLTTPRLVSARIQARRVDRDSFLEIDHGRRFIENVIYVTDTLGHAPSSSRVNIALGSSDKTVSTRFSADAKVARWEFGGGM